MRDSSKIRETLDWKAFSHTHKYLQEKGEHLEQITKCSIEKIANMADR
jgi:hypothetical protein